MTALPTESVVEAFATQVTLTDDDVGRCFLKLLFVLFKLHSPRRVSQKTEKGS